MYDTAHRDLLKWYEKNGRHSLPWRNTTNLYHVYLSEIMLQQTQVNRVREEYYPKFLQTYPSLKELAKAQETEVLSLWSGLGYYSRARNLHKTAQILQNELPRDEKELQKLPGIGRYTASAICCFGDNQAVAVVDTNIKRLLLRYFALYDCKEQEIWQKAHEFLNSQAPRKHNLALMDLGSMLCTPKNPKCEECPLYSTCKGKEEAELYTTKRKTNYETLELFFGIYLKENKIALVHSEGSMYKGMLTLPHVDPIEQNLIANYKHSYTKYRITAKLYKLEEFEQENIVWVEMQDFLNMPISSLTKKAYPFIERLL